MQIIGQARAESGKGQAAKIELLLFECNNQTFAARTTTISTLIRSDTVTLKLGPTFDANSFSPRLLESFLGMISLSGTPVFRLSRLLGLEEDAVEPNSSDTNNIVLTWYKERLVGLAIDHIFEVRSAELNQLTTLPPLIEQVRQRKAAWALWQPNVLQMGSPLDTETVKTGAVTETELIVLIDFANLFDEAEQTQLDLWVSQQTQTE